jgi:hypothetical protein
MIFVIFFVIAIASLFGFGQLLGAHKKEKNFSTTMLDQLKKNKTDITDRLEEFKKRAQAGENPFAKKQSWWDKLTKR